MVSNEMLRTLAEIFPGLDDLDNNETGDTPDEMHYDELSRKISALKAKGNSILCYDVKDTSPLLVRRRAKLKSEAEELLQEANRMEGELGELGMKIDGSPPSPIRWVVLAESKKVTQPGKTPASDDSFLLLATKKAVAMRRYDDGSNDWETSELRKWLNGEFFKTLSDRQKQLIVPTVRKDYDSDWLHNIDKSLYARISPNNHYALPFNMNPKTVDLVSLLNLREVLGLLQDTENACLKFRYKPVRWWTIRPHRTTYTGGMSNPGMHIKHDGNKYVALIDTNGKPTPFGAAVDECHGVRPIVAVDLGKV